MQMLYNNKAYESVAEDYHSLHDKLKHKPEFLFEEAQCLSKTGQYTEAIRVLERAKRLSGDPMIRYMIAKTGRHSVTTGKRKGNCFRPSKYFRNGCILTIC